VTELKPCPLCGGKAELDGRQAYRNLSTGMIENQSVVYCTKCTVNVSICHPDHRDLSHDDLNYVVIAQWNTRTAAHQADISRLQEALKFYANRIHWMGLAGDSELQTVLIAGKLWDMNGWAVAEDALSRKER